MYISCGYLYAQHKASFVAGGMGFVGKLPFMLPFYKHSAVRVRGGYRLFYGMLRATAAGEPTCLTDAMVRNAAAYRDVEIDHMLVLGGCAYCLPEYAENFCHNALFVSPPAREAVEQGRANFTPTFFYRVPRLFETTLPVDVALVQVTPPDENGICSLGISVD